MKYRHIWVFMDLPNAAGDNGYYLFKYANECDDLKDIDKRFVFSKTPKSYSDVPEMENKYLASSKLLKIKILLGLQSPDEEYRELRKTGKILPNRSLLHRSHLLFADFIITSHPDNEIIYPFWGNYPHLAGLARSKTIFLQHGVTKDDISYWLNKYDKRIARIITVSQKEKEAFLSPKYGYDESFIKVLGFPRFDYLERLEDRKEIILMPTWRRQYDQFEDEEFMQTNYYKAYSRLINDRELLDYLESKGYKLLFKPHRNTLKFVHLLEIPDSVKSANDISYNEIFNHSSLLVTDYSSVAFDFAYLKKPVVYFHPDNDYHFDMSKSYFKYDTMGFGSVTKSHEELKKEIIRLVENDCKMDEVYRKRVEDFFEYIDKNNCRRVIDEILNVNFYY